VKEENHFFDIENFYNEKSEWGLIFLLVEVAF